MTPRDELAEILLRAPRGNMVARGNWLELNGPAVLALIDAAQAYKQKCLDFGEWSADTAFAVGETVTRLTEEPKA